MGELNGRTQGPNQRSSLLIWFLFLQVQNRGVKASPQKEWGFQKCLPRIYKRLILCGKKDAVVPNLVTNSQIVEQELQGLIPLRRNIQNRYSNQQDSASGMTQEFVHDHIPVSDAGVPRAPIATVIVQNSQHTPDHFAIHCQARESDIQCRVTEYDSRDKESSIV